ncbi:MAG: ATP-binding cassette domain-containing protein, partial [Paracoccaceae bacterium]
PLRRGIADLGRMQDSARRVTALLPKETQAPPATVRHPDPVNTPPLAMRGVTYRHPGATRPVLEGFDLSLTPGRITALTGPSGGGKSTVLALAAGLVDPEAGEIRLFGQPLATLPEPEIRAGLAFLPQRSALLGDSFFDMLALADPALTEAEAQAALAATALDDTVARRGGLNAPLRENGAGLSGGEQRRLALARTLLRRPRLLLLDEPTEGLDRAAAARVLDGIRRFLPDATILTASHRAVEKRWADHSLYIAGQPRPPED